MQKTKDSHACVPLYNSSGWLLTLGIFQAYKVMSTEVEGGGQSQLFKDYYAHNTNGRQAGSLKSRFAELVPFTFVIWGNFLTCERLLHIDFFSLSVGCEMFTITKLR
jgi:hypothetical protein